MGEKHGYQPQRGGPVNPPSGEAARPGESLPAFVRRVLGSDETLRDRFAMAALTGLLSDDDMMSPETGGLHNAAIHATMAYSAADAMLAERAKRDAIHICTDCRTAAHGAQRCPVCGETIERAANA